jgi:hypothetical protein
MIVSWIDMIIKRKGNLHQMIAILRNFSPTIIVGPLAANKLLLLL